MSTVENYNERELLIRIANGDESAFTIIFNQFRKNVYSIAVTLTHDEYIAREMVQEVFAKVWSVRASLPGINDFEAWLFIVIRNTAYKTLRKIASNREIVRRSALKTDDISNETDDSILFRDYQQVLREAIDKLPPQQKTVWQLARMEGLKRNEIAERMQLKPDTVKEYLALATKSIKAYCLGRLELKGWLIVVCWGMQSKIFLP